VTGDATDPMEEALMGRVMIACPVTRREISTGIEADPSTFNATPVFFADTYCPFCRSVHQWFAKDAWVCEPDSQARRGAA